MRNQLKQGAVMTAVAAALAAATVVMHRQTRDTFLIAYWYAIALVIYGSLMSFAIGRRYLDLPVAPGRVLAVVPAYNETTETLYACVESLLSQTVPVDIVVVDDGSDVPVEPYRHERVRWIRQANTGKRGAQVAALRRVSEREYEYILTVDSDSQLYPDALEHLLRAMSNPAIWAATGWIYVRNHGRNLITTAADIDIGSSCVMMRASRSMLGALETTSGALALYRSELVFDHLEEYAQDMWGAGDDRWLALRALMRGQVVAVNEAVVATDMPTTVKATFRQRKRWARSWFYMLPYVYQELRWNAVLSPTFGLLHTVVMPITFLFAVAVALVSAHHGVGHAWTATAVFFAAYLTVRFGQSALYLIGRPDMPLWRKVYSWIVGTPASILMSMILLMPAKYWALLQLKDRTWGTRKGGDLPHPAPASAR